MTPDSENGVSVLIIDPDAAIRRLVDTVLKRAGFRTSCACDLEAAALLDQSSFAVIVRDLNLGAAQRRGALQELAATAPELLRRTVILTAESAHAEVGVRAGSVFTIVGKPFDIDQLVNAVSACARDSRDEDPLAGRRTPQRPRKSEADVHLSARLEPLQRFASTAPSLQRLLSLPVISESEATLRSEMRRTLDVLATTLLTAGDGEPSATRAAELRAASTVAGRLATVPPTAAVVTRRNH